MNALRRRTASAAAVALALAGPAAALAVTAAGPASAAAGSGSGTAGSGSASARLTSAVAGTRDEGVQYCQSIASLGPGDIMGPCVSYYQSYGHDTAATGVYECQNTLVPAGVFPNVGTCVSFLNNFKGT